MALQLGSTQIPILDNTRYLHSINYNSYLRYGMIIYTCFMKIYAFDLAIVRRLWAQFLCQTSHDLNYQLLNQLELFRIITNLHFDFA